MYIKKYESYANFNQKEYLKWKRKNVSYRGVSDISEPNGNLADVLGSGLYSAALSNIKMAKSYGDVYFVVNAVPSNPKIFNTLNDWEIWSQRNLFYPISKEHGLDYPDKNLFNKYTTIDAEMLKMGYDGVIIKGREMVNYKPKDVMYFKTEDQLKDYYEFNVLR